MGFLPPPPPPADKDNILDALSISDQDVIFMSTKTDINDHINLYTSDESCGSFECGQAHCTVHICGKHDCSGFSCETFEDNTSQEECEDLVEKPPH